MIRFILKIFILLCLLFIVLAFFLPEQHKQESSSADNSVTLFSGAAAVGALLHDVNGFCERNPQSCATGKGFFAIMADKARQGAEFAYQWLGASFHKGAENTERHLSAPEPANLPEPPQEQKPRPENLAAESEPPAAGKAASKSAIAAETPRPLKQPPVKLHGEKRPPAPSGKGAARKSPQAGKKP